MSNPEAKLQSMLARREKYFRRLQNIVDICKQLTAENLGAFKVRLEQLDSIYRDFDNVIDQINTLNISLDEKDRIDTEQSVNAFDNLYYYVKEVANNYSAELSSSGGSGRSSDSSAMGAVRLPKISLPKFDGKLMSWRHFRDSYLSLVHNNPALKDIDRFNYLKSSLSGYPLEIISSIPFDSHSYSQAWGALLKNYDNPRVLAANYLEHVLDFVPLKSDSLNELQRFLSAFRENISALKKLPIPDLAQFMLLHLGLKMLDQDTRYNFEKDYTSETFPTCDSLISFVESKCKILQINSVSGGNSSKSSSSPARNSKTIKNTPSKVKLHSFVGSNVDSCLSCSKVHRLHECEKFKKKTPFNRFQFVKRHRLCYNCFSSGHRNSDCSSLSRCRVCKDKHHSLLHFGNNKDASPKTQANNLSLENPVSDPGSSRSNVVVEDSNTTTVLQSSSSAPPTNVLLGTVLLHIRDAYGHLVPFRAVLDSGSQRSFLSQAFANRLGFQPCRSRVLISGIGSSPTLASKGVVKTTISPRLNSNIQLDFQAEILTSVTSQVPSAILPSSIRQDFASVELADPSFDIPGPVDGLLGNEVFVKALLQHQPHLNSSPSALSTIFGVVIMGPVATTCGLVADTNVSSLFVEEPPQELSKVLQQFWEVEEPCYKPQVDPEDAICERHFVETHSRDSTGRYIVRLPFRRTAEVPTNNRQLALNRLYSIERRFRRQPASAESYQQFLSEYRDLGHMKLTTEPSKYTIPHHAVYKPESTTTKVRVVFDASAKQHNDVSLNQCLLAGPVLQSSLADIICNFRLHAVAFTADICKMYRQVLLHPDDRCYQHIVWRKFPDAPVDTYALQTVTYGVVSASFLAIRALFQLSYDEGGSFPRAARVLQEDIYVDDIVSGAETEEEALQIQGELHKLCAAGGFSLQKWLSNSSRFMESVSSEASENCLFPLVSDSNSIHKILGIQWNPQLDVFTFTFQCLEFGRSKRSVLSTIARLFDPLGWISPVTFFAKCFMQKLWLLHLEWDEVIPDTVLVSWENFVSQLNYLKNISIPRQVLIPKLISCHILGFCDASEAGYGCVIYVRSSDNHGNVSLRLLKARTKVAPLKLLTVPRLELCGAILLTRTLLGLEQCLKRFPPHSIKLWTDSSIVLSWLRMEPHNLKTYVAHRVEEINRYFPESFWGHVATVDNPADYSSRGVLPQQILNCDLWWKGPSWAYLQPEQWPGSIERTSIDVPEVKGSVVLLETNVMSYDFCQHFVHFIERFSSLNRLKRVVAWAMRFLNNSRGKGVHRSGHLRLNELREALLWCVLIVQRVTFHQDIQDLRNGKPVRRSLRMLSPFLDSSGHLRVGGRLSNSTLPWSSKHPLLLPKNSHFTNLLVIHYHQSYLHVGANTLRALLNRDYWIISGRSLIRKLVHECSTCFRFHTKSQIPLMGDLPSSRVTPPGRPFTHVGVDFAGPLFIRSSNLRKAAISKAYICVFLCMATKAIHIELVSSLNTDAFLASLDRFMSRRGAGQYLYSDQGTNFVGAARQLKEIREFLFSLKNPLMDEQLNKRNIIWQFNPPFSPNFGGLWEAGVKSVKTHLLRLTNSQAFTFEELATILSKIEAILNSRPLCPVSNDPHDFDYLSPGHFLVGGPLVALPEIPLDDLPLNRLSRWQLVQRISQQLWRRWSVEYLNTLQQRYKWNKSTRNLKIGDLVLLKAPNTAPLHWPTARVVNTHEGHDGVVRVVTVRTSQGEYKRPVSALVPFPASTD